MDVEELAQLNCTLDWKDSKDQRHVSKHVRTSEGPASRAVGLKTPMDRLTVKLKDIVGLKQQTWCGGSLCIWTTDFCSYQTFKLPLMMKFCCLGLTAQGESPMACIGAYKPFPVLDFSLWFIPLHLFSMFGLTLFPYCGVSLNSVRSLVYQFIKFLTVFYGLTGNKGF